MFKIKNYNKLYVIIHIGDNSDVWWGGIINEGLKKC